MSTTVMNGDYRSTRLRLRGEGKTTLTFITHTPARGKRTSLSHVLNSPVWPFSRWLQTKTQNTRHPHSDTLIPSTSGPRLGSTARWADGAASRRGRCAPWPATGCAKGIGFWQTPRACVDRPSIGKERTKRAAGPLCTLLTPNGACRHSAGRSCRKIHISGKGRPTVIGRSLRASGLTLDLV